MVKESGKSGKCVAHISELRLHQKTPAAALECHPSMSHSITAVTTKDEPSVVTHVEELAPGPEGEVVAVSFPGLLELIRGLPVIVLSELIFI
jgi:hypothetical protein